MTSGHEAIGFRHVGVSLCLDLMKMSAVFMWLGAQTIMFSNLGRCDDKLEKTTDDRPMSGTTQQCRQYHDEEFAGPVHWCFSFLCLRLYHRLWRDRRCRHCRCRSTCSGCLCEMLGSRNLNDLRRWFCDIFLAGWRVFWRVFRNGIGSGARPAL